VRGAGYFTALDSFEVAQMLVDHFSDERVMQWVKNLIEWEMPLSAFIAEHEDPDILIQAFADAFPESVSPDSEYE
tara:strand:+ start:8103 stop:8327 length:225 start_codon:yes stop_codon:yes gene_type:complete